MTTLTKIKTAKFFSKENIAKAIFIALAAFSILAVFTIIGYLLYASIPAFRDIGFSSLFSVRNGRQNRKLSGYGE